MSDNEIKIYHHIDKREKPKLTKDMMRLIGIPESLHMAVLSHFQKEQNVGGKTVMVFKSRYLDKLYRSFREYAKNKKPIHAIVQGEPRSGKSSLLCVLAKFIKLHTSYSAFYMTVGNLKESVNLKKMYEGTVSFYDKCILVDVLFLDELGEEGRHEMFMEKLCSILRNRMDNNKPTVICTEFKMEHLEEMYKFHPPLVKYLKRFQSFKLEGVN